MLFFIEMCDYIAVIDAHNIDVFFI
jgi:hypothetical protein